MSGRYLHDLPGLTSQRLGEFYGALLHATDDPGAMAEVTYYAAGGMRIEIHWHQLGIRHHYPATLTRKQIEEVLATGVDEDLVFRNFATMTIESVRQMRNKLAEQDAPEGTVEPPTLSNTAASEMALMLGAARARELQPLMSRFEYVAGQWMPMGELERPGYGSGPIYADDVQMNGVWRRVWTRDAPVHEGSLGWADQIPPAGDGNTEGDSDGSTHPEVPRHP